MSFPLKASHVSERQTQTPTDGDTVMSDNEFIHLIEELGLPEDNSMAIASAIPEDSEFGGPESAGNFTPTCSQQSAPSGRAAANSESPLQPRLSQGSNRSRELSNDIPGARRRVVAFFHPLADAVLYVLSLVRFWHAQNLLVILSDFFWSCVSDSKCFSAIPPQQVSEHRGITWSFVFASGASIPKEAQEVIFFFERMKGLSQQIPWDNYVVPTSNLRENLIPKKAPGSKHISGVMKKTFVDVDESNIFRGSEGKVDYSKVLSAGDGMMTGDVFTPLDLFTIHVGFTGAIFTKLEKASAPSQGSTQESAAPSIASEAPRDYFVEIEKDSQLFCIVTVSCLPNVDGMGFIVNRLINPQYDTEKNSERQRGLREQFHRILIHQSSGMMGDTSGEMPSSYYSNPSGRLGPDRICSPYLDPLKVLYFLTEKYTDIRDVKIIGYYDIDFQADPRTNSNLQKYLEYSTAYIGQVKASREKLRESLRDFNKPRNSESKKKRARGGPEEVEENDEHLPSKEYDIPPIPGWPVSKNAEMYTEFRESLCQIYLKYRPLNEIDVNMSFKIWSVNLGGIPPVVESALLTFILYDLKKDEVTDLRSVILKDVEVKSSLERTLATYYVKNSNSLQGIATPGCLLLRYNDITRHVKKEVESGNMMTEEADRMNQSIIAYGMSAYGSMVTSGQFNSNRISQLFEIKDRVKKMEMKGEMNVYESLNEYASILMEDDPFVSCNAYEVVMRLVFLSLEDVNRFEHLNSINLYNKFQLLVSMIMYTMGVNSNTTIPFGRLIMLAPCAGTLREPCQKDFVRKINSLNNAGKDITHTKVSEIYQLLCRILGILASLQGCNLGSRATPVSMENASSIQIDDKGNIVGLPDEFSSWIYYIYPECRNEEVWKMLIDMIPRGKFVASYTQTTIEGPNKKRENILKILCYPIPVVQICTNQPIPNQDRNEQVTTIAAVTHVTEAGSTPITDESETGEINDIHRNEFECRASEFEGHTEKHAPIFLALMHAMCIYQICLPSWAGVYTPEINPATIALLDHMSFFTRHLNSMFHPSCQTNSGPRLRQVYESRASAETALYLYMLFCMQCRDMEEAARKARIAFQYDAVSIFQVPRIQYELIRRCMNWGPVIYSCCYIKEVNMPIVQTSILVELLNMDSPPPEDERSERRRSYDAISTWLFECVHNQRFCPVNYLADTSEFCEYISSSGTEFGTKNGRGGFRSDQAQNGWKDSIEKMTVESQLSEELYQICGEELLKACTISKESIICIIRDSFKFSLGLQKFLGFSYDPDKQFRFFGIRDQLRFKFTSPKGTPPLLVKSAWMRANESVSVGVGFHWLQLLIMGSLIGPIAKLKIHSKCINDLSRSLVRQLLINSPASAITSDTISMPCFNCFTGLHESIVMGEYEKMEHFLRSGKDVGFARTGNVSECRGFRNFAPEDILHMGPNCEFSRRIGCELTDVPPVTALSYAIRKGRYYCVYNKSEDLLGYLTFTGSEVEVVACNSRDNDPDRELQSFSLSTKTWNSEIGGRGFVMLPMIWRSGACVLIPPRAGDSASREMIGCIVPPPVSIEDPIHNDGNYCYNIQSYFASVRFGETVPVHVLDVMKNLLPIGKKLFLKCESQSAAPLIRRVRVPLSAESRSTHAIRVFLTGPSVKIPVPGKVYVAYAVGASAGDEASQNNSGEIACVDPWELLVSAGQRTIFESISP